MRLSLVTPLLAGLAALSACSLESGPDHVMQCIAELNPVGAYGYPAGVAAPTVVPEVGGAQEGAAAVNACIQAKAAAAGVPQQSFAAPGVLSGGQVQVATQGGVTARTTTLGTLPASVPPAVEPPQSVPTATPAQAMAPASCRLEMSGGSGYACVR